VFLHVYTVKGASADAPNRRTKHAPYGVLILKVKTIWYEKSAVATGGLKV